MSESNNTAMVPVSPVGAIATGDLFDPNGFNHMMRLAKMFAASPLVPKHLREGGPEQAIANCAICLSMARELQENPIVVMNNIHIVNGKFGWSSSYMIARANQSGKFRTPINWRVTGKGDALTVVAYATTKNGDLVESVAVTMAMAKAEGWTKNAKYQSMPEVMFRYRSAAFLIRMYAPETTLGYHTSDELETMPATVVTARTVSRNPLAEAILPTIEPAVTQAEVVPTPVPASSPALDEARRLVAAYLDNSKGVCPPWLPEDELLAAYSDNQLSSLVDRLNSELEQPQPANGTLAL